MLYGYDGVDWRVCRSCRNNGSLSALEKVDGVQSDRVPLVNILGDVVAGGDGL